jgi:uncharacterized protein (TIGR02271 family)
MSNESSQLKELKASGYEIAEGEPDIRGWDVQNKEGQTIGEVDELLFDEQSCKVRYLIVDIDDKNSTADDRKVLIPIGLAVLHEKEDDVVLPTINSQQLAMLPVYKKGSLDVSTEKSVRNILAGVGVTGVAADTLGSTTDDSEDFYAHDHFDEDKLYKNRNTSTDQTIPIIEENINVGKRVVQTGGVRVKTNMVETPVEETVRLREEHVTIERNPVNKPLTEGSFAAFKESSIELTERAEVPVVSKEARVVEEISIGKEVNQREETIQDTVRKTEVDVEQLSKDELSKRDLNKS